MLSWSCGIQSHGASTLRSREIGRLNHIALKFDRGYGSTASRRQLNFVMIGKFQTWISRLWDYTGPQDKTSYWILKRHPTRVNGNDHRLIRVWNRETRWCVFFALQQLMACRRLQYHYKHTCGNQNEKSHSYFKRIFRNGSNKIQPYEVPYTCASCWQYSHVKLPILKYYS